MSEERTQEALPIRLAKVTQYYARTDAFTSIAAQEAAALIERQAAEIARLTEEAEKTGLAYADQVELKRTAIARMQAAEAEARQLREQQDRLGERIVELHTKHDAAEAQVRTLNAQLAACELDAARLVALMPDADGKTLLNMPRVHPPFDFKCEQRYTNIDALRAAIDGAVAKKGG